jgi:hypothetical protein
MGWLSGVARGEGDGRTGLIKEFNAEDAESAEKAIGARKRKKARKERNEAKVCMSAIL